MNKRKLKKAEKKEAGIVKPVFSKREKKEIYAMVKEYLEKKGGH